MFFEHAIISARIITGLLRTHHRCHKYHISIKQPNPISEAIEFKVNLNFPWSDFPWMEVWQHVYNIFKGLLGKDKSTTKKDQDMWIQGFKETSYVGCYPERCAWENYVPDTSLRILWFWPDQASLEVCCLVGALCLRNLHMLTQLNFAPTLLLPPLLAVL